MIQQVSVRSGGQALEVCPSASLRSLFGLHVTAAECLPQAQQVPHNSMKYVEPAIIGWARLLYHPGIERCKGDLTG
jgi:hypothetical protein